MHERESTNALSQEDLGIIQEHNRLRRTLRIPKEAPEIIKNRSGLKPAYVLQTKLVL